MGGIAIVVGAVLGYLVAHVRRSRSRSPRTGWTLLALIVGLARRRLPRRLPRRARAAATSGCASGARRSGIVARRARGSRCLALRWVDVVDAPLVHAAARPRPRRRSGWFVVAVVVIVYATANAVNLTDGLDGLAAGSSAFVFAAFMIICFTEFRHPAIYGVRPASALDLAVVAAAMLGACAGFLWWNAAPARDLHGRHRLARDRRRDGRPRAAQQAPCCCSRSSAASTCVETLSVIAQVISYRGFRRRVLRMAPIHHHFEVGGWSEFTVIVRFWLFAGICVALGARHLLRRLPPHPRGRSSDARRS